MQIHDENLHKIREAGLESFEPTFRGMLSQISRFRKINGSTKILDVGTGTGWFPILCKREGLQCRGIDISPQMIRYSREFGSRYGIEPDTEVVNAEEEFGESEYDIIISTSTLEHIEYWEESLINIYRALKPGGLLLLHTTNKLNIRSGEHPLPFYSWLPNPIRYRIMVMTHGNGTMRLGVDFNQFTHGSLRSALQRTGFTRIYDIFDVLQPNSMANHKKWKELAIRLGKSNTILRRIGLALMSGTFFICIKEEA